MSKDGGGVRPVPAWAGQVRCQLTPLGVNSSGKVTSRCCFQPLSSPVLLLQRNLETDWEYDTSAGGRPSGSGGGVRGGKERVGGGDRLIVFVIGSLSLLQDTPLAQWS